MLNAGRPTVVAILVTAAFAGHPVTARAQEARLSVGFGAGIGLPLHSDLNFTAPAWDASARVALTPRLLFEGAFSEWRHTESTERTNITLQGPSGVIGRIGRLTEETLRTGQVIQANVLGRSAPGRLEAFAGGGLGFLILTRRFRQMLADCTSSVEGACRDSDNRFRGSSLTGQVVGGADVRLTPRLSAFGQLRFSVPLEDVGSSDVRVVAGVRAGLW